MRSGRLTVLVQLGNDNATACPSRENEASLDYGEDGKTFSVLQDFAWYDSVKTIVAIVNEGLNCCEAV